MITFIFFISLLIFLFLRIPVAFAIGLSSLLGIVLHETLPLMTIAQRIFISLNSFPLMAIPFFILAGVLMQTGGISRRLVDFASSLVGHFTGGLAMVAIVTSMLFGAISGSTTATTIAVGSIVIPAMIAKGYDMHYSAANQAVAGSLGGIIPPSIGMILYGVVGQVSVGDMFIAGIIPGIMITISLLISAYFISKKEGYVGVEKSSLLDVWISFKDAFFALLMPMIILGGIYSGVFTPTEAAAVAVIYAFIVGVVIYKEIKIKNIINVLTDSASTTAVIMMIIGTAGAFSYFINMLGIPAKLTAFVSEFTTSPIVFLLIVNIILLIAGMFLEGAAAILMLVPLLLPISNSLGIDPIHFGIILMVNLSIGLVTPPVGMNLFAAARITNVNIISLSKAVMPFIFILLINLILVTFLPILSTFLPSLMNR